MIGVWEWEKQITQSIGIDLDMCADVAGAAVTDELEDALDYKAVAQRVREFAEGSRLQLVETLAEGIAGIVIDEFPVSWVRVRVNKGGAVKNCSSVGIEIERGVKSGD